MLIGPNMKGLKTPEKIMVGKVARVRRMSERRVVHSMIMLGRNVGRMWKRNQAKNPGARDEMQKK